MSPFAWTLVQALGWALICFAWKGALIGVATALSLRLMRNASPQSRYALLCLSLLLCLAIPGFDAYCGIETASRRSGWFRATDSLIVPTEHTREAFTIENVLPWLVAAWLVGVAAMSCRLTAGLLWVRQIGHAFPAWPDPRWQGYMSTLAVRCGLSRPVTLCVATHLTSPLTIGWWRPLVLVPAVLLTRMPPDLLEAVLAHEVAHIKRADYLVNLLQSVSEALLFFHPAVWWLSRQIRIERECVADQIAGTLIQSPRRLALALEQLDALQSTSARYAPVAQSARGGHLLDRIRRLCHPVPPSPHWVACVPAITVCFVALCVTAQTLWQVPVSQHAAGIVPAGLLASNHVVVIDDKSGQVLFQKRPDDIVPIASLTKLMTAMVVLDARPDMNRTIRIDASDAEAFRPSRTGLPAGASLPLHAVLQLALMSSNNSAAYALAHDYPGGFPAFQAAMRTKIATLGLKHTTIEEPTGLSPLNTSTATDVSLMVNAAARYPAIARASTAPRSVVPIDGKLVEYQNTNPLVGQKGWDIALSKTGFTDAAGRCLIMRLHSVRDSVTMVFLDAGPTAFPARDAINIRRLLLAHKLA
ncbi:M56 family metallopeptidase [Paraburkholderia sp. SUR17]|uniref:M56 family metallopeptidase n=1 Tax=Paraburkholderia sp. SUR17 TaxID=3034358 RepID=UPI002407DCF3|nr:M56 family metallopeptidase [Paraburkholderia sp. SUR17]WEY37733.1 M56 family metallopeptidase [Paraburkholderia sp. SUR17]